MFSYGSGLSAAMFSFHLRDGQHPFSLSSMAKVMNIGEMLKSRSEVFVFSLNFIPNIIPRYQLIFRIIVVFTDETLCLLE